MSAVELPFLYQTRTILRCASRVPAVWGGAKPKPKLHKCLSVATSGTSEESSESFLSHKAKEAVAQARKKSRHSITRTEKHVFDRIFQDIKQPSEKTIVRSQSADEIDPNALLRLFLPESAELGKVRSEKGLKHTIHADCQSLERPRTRFQDRIKRYPSALRHAALQATQQQPPPPDWPAPLPYKSFQPIENETQPNLTPSVKTRDPRHGVYRPLDAPLEIAAETVLQEGPQLRNFDAIKAEELARGSFRGKTADYVEASLKNISAELQACVSGSPQSGAFKIWDVCRKRIFPVVKLLNKEPKPRAQKTTPDKSIAAGLKPELAGDADNSNKKKPVTKPEKVASAKAPAKDTAAPPTEIPKLTLPDGVSALTAVTTLYPTLTLLTLRLLITHYPTSPFPLALYTEIRQLSPQSRILGLNVHFYNTLLAHTWHVYSDLAALGALLAEMGAGVVEVDAATYAVILAVEEERWTQLQRGKGTRGGAWWARPEQVRRYRALVEWKQVVAGKLQEQGLGHLVAEREYGGVDLLGGSSDGGGAGRPVAESPSVWL